MTEVTMSQRRATASWKPVEPAEDVQRRGRPDAANGEGLPPSARLSGTPQGWSKPLRFTQLVGQNRRRCAPARTVKETKVTADHAISGKAPRTMRR